MDKSENKSQYDEVFGEILYRYWHGERNHICFLREKSDVLYPINIREYFFEYDDFYDYTKDILQFAKGNILDIGCGAGRHVLHFQNKGFDVMGIDILDKCKQVCDERGCKNIQLMDIFDNDLEEGSFDTIALLGNNINIGGSEEGIIKFLKTIKSLLKRDGQLLMDCSYPIDRSAAKYIISKDKVYLEETFRYEYDELIGEWITIISMHPNKLKEITKAAGFAVEDVFESDFGRYSALVKPI